MNLMLAHALKQTWTASLSEAENLDFFMALMIGQCEQARPGFAESSNSQIGWRHGKSDDESGAVQAHLLGSGLINYR